MSDKSGDIGTENMSLCSRESTEDYMIVYPEEYTPKNCPIHIKNSLQLHCSVEESWRLLVSLLEWPNFQPEISKIVIEEDADHINKLGYRFSWIVFGMKMKCEVIDFVVGERLGWTTVGFGIHAYHTWLLIPNEEGCLAVCEELQRGFVCNTAMTFNPKRFQNFNKIWLDLMRNKAERLSGYNSPVGKRMTF